MFFAHVINFLNEFNVTPKQKGEREGDQATDC